MGRVTRKALYPGGLAKNEIERSLLMKPLTENHLFGSLRQALENRNDHPMKLDFKGSTSIIEIRMPKENVFYVVYRLKEKNLGKST
jgi:hypothetical protein